MAKPGWPNSHGFQFDFNYTWSKSIDLGSDAERQNTWGGTGFSTVINSWNIRQMRAVSDWDATHSINANWIYQLPFGKGKWIGTNSGILDRIIGGWEYSGLYRWTSGLPFAIDNGLGNWATNWDFTGYAMLKGAAPKTGVYIGPDGSPMVFADPSATKGAFRFAYPGESGQRNSLRGPGYFSIDMGLAKTFKLYENHQLKFSAEAFNVTNSVRFDPAYVNSSLVNDDFGKFTRTLTRYRTMQFALRYSF